MATSGFLPRRDELIDAAFLTGLSALALLGFHAAFGGVTYLVLGLVGVVAGLLLAHLTVRAAVPVPGVIVAAVVVAVLLSGLALGSSAIAGVFPSLEGLRALPGLVVHGWKDLLTTVRPVGDAGNLLVLPYLLGIAMGVWGHSLAQRVRPLAAPLLPVVLTLGLGILLGSDRPVSLALQGGAFAAVALAWLAVRQARQAAVVVQSGHRLARPLAGALVLAVASAGALALGPNLPGTNGPRTVLQVQPPLDQSDLASPLSGFRRYTPKSIQSLSDKVVVSAQGVPAGVPIRLAVLDRYDGRVWGSANRSTPRSSGIVGFARSGSELSNDSQSGQKEVVLSPGPGLLSKTWVPLVGTLDRITLTGPRQEQLRSALRVNLATDSAIVTAGLKPEDKVKLTTRLPVVTDLSKLDDAEPAGGPILEPSEFAFVQASASKMAGGAPTPMKKVAAIAASLKRGYYSNGNTPQRSLPGHGSGRITEFLQAPQLNGDDEQYAAAMALLANAVGVPARVVLQVLPDASGQYLGRGVEADVQVNISGLGWVGIGASSFTPADDRIARPRVTQQINQPEPKLVPPALPPQAISAPSASQAEVSAGRKRDRASGFVIPAFIKTTARYAGPPTLLALAFAGTVLGLKARRRKRRRTQGEPARRIAMGWREVLDTARDLRLDVEPGGTRREQARALPRAALLPLANVADAAVFGPTPPSDAAAAGFWTQVENDRRVLLGDLTRWERLRAALSVRSLLAR